MKVAVALCLFACVALSHAAFSGSLVQQATPILNQAMFKIRLATSSRNAEGSQLQTDIVAGLQSHIAGLLAQVEGAITIGSQVHAAILAQIEQAQQQLSQLVGGVTSQVTDIITGLLDGWNNLWGSIWSKDANKAVNKGLWDSITGTIGGWLGGFNISNIIAKIKEFLATHLPGFEIHTAAGIVMSQMGVPSFIVTFIQGHLESLLANNRGLFDTIWGHLSGFGAQLVQQIQSIAAGIIAAGQASFSEIQALATQFVEQAQQQAGVITGQAAQQLLHFLGPYAQDLGALYQQVQDQVNAILAAVNN